MEAGWKLVYTLDDPSRAEIAKNILAQEDIIAVVLNKRDSAYQSFGSYEIYVKEEHATQAREILVKSAL